MTQDPIPQAEAEVALEKPTQRLSIREILRGWHTPMIAARCRVCLTDYRPSLRSDGRCGLCKARGRYWRPEQLGTRAQVSIRCRWSSLDGLAGVGRRLSIPEDGWKIRLHDGDGRELYFGAGSVTVDWELPVRIQVERGLWAMGGAKRNGQTFKS